MNKFFLKWATGRVIIINIIIYILYQFLVLIPVSEKMKLLNGQNRIFDLNLYLLNGSFKNDLVDYGEAGRVFYVNHIWIDFIYPLIYGFVFAIVLVFLSKEIKGSFYRKIFILPILTVFIDYLENLGFYLCIETFPNSSDALLSFTVAMNGLKWLLVALCGFSVVFLGIKKMLKK